MLASIAEEKVKGKHHLYPQGVSNVRVHLHQVFPSCLPALSLDLQTWQLKRVLPNR